MTKKKQHPKDKIIKNLENILLLSEGTAYESYIQAEVNKIKTQLSKLK
jgi:hypothetical protein